MNALIFDFDGLIVDSELPEFLCWQRVYRAHGQRLEIEDWSHVIGGADVIDMEAELDKLVGRSLDWAKLDAERLEHHHELMSQQELLPGVQALFEQGAREGWRIGVASNSSVDWVSRGLKRYGLAPLVGALRGRDTASRPKPHPAPYLEVLEDLGAKAAGSFGFEDSATGVRAAKAAGLHVVAVPNPLTRTHDLSEAHQILQSLERFELPQRGS